VTLLKAVSLEKLAKLMLKCGQFDAGEEEEEEEEEEEGGVLQLR
jgi:hypothetical protein